MPHMQEENLNTCWKQKDVIYTLEQHDYMPAY